MRISDILSIDDGLVLERGDLEASIGTISTVDLLIEDSIVFIGNKMDLVEERAISDAELQSVAETFQSPCLLSSAKTGENTETAFLRLAEMMEARG